MEFTAYPDIKNLYNKKFIDKIREYQFDAAEIEWVAEVKIDGSNLQCVIDCDDNFIVGTRTRVLQSGSDFQGYERAMQAGCVESALKTMKEWIKANYNTFPAVKNNCFSLRVFGELCGGMYRHPNVEKIKGAVKIQGRINYHPDNVWIPFDIELVDEADQVIYIFDQLDVVDMCKRVKLPYPIITHVGTFDELIDLPTDFNDITGNILFNLPIIENNITEGLVLKPNKALYFNDSTRVMVKSKNDKFGEKTKKIPKDPKEIIPMNELELKYFEHFREYITESRLMSVISKVGTVTTKQFGLIMGMFIQDLYEDFDAEYGVEVKGLENTLPVTEFDLVKVKKELGKEIAEFIRPIFLKYLEDWNED